jgi:aminoglycoside 3-N-acetyltransferase I
MPIRFTRLRAADIALAKQLFKVMAEVFESECDALSDRYVEPLLADERFWAVAAFSGDEIVGGITAHTLPMTRSESSEIFIYDVAVRADQQRRGIGRGMMDYLRTEAAALGVDVLFVPADDEDTHALDFYRALGGAAAPVTIFTFTRS